MSRYTFKIFERKNIHPSPIFEYKVYKCGEREPVAVSERMYYTESLAIAEAIEETAKWQERNVKIEESSDDDSCDCDDDDDDDGDGWELMHKFTIGINFLSALLGLGIHLAIILEPWIKYFIMTLSLKQSSEQSLEKFLKVFLYQLRKQQPMKQMGGQPMKILSELSRKELSELSQKELSELPKEELDELMKLAEAQLEEQAKKKDI